MKKLAVVALGGNAILRGSEQGTIEQQEQNTTETLENLIYLIKDGYDLVITHGNGPQVGNILMRNDAGEQLYNIAPMPLDICVADSQGGIGYMLERMMRNVLSKHGIQKNVISLISLVEVDCKDAAFKNPSKRIGKIYTKAEAEQLSREKGWGFKPSAKREGGYRRVVPSPVPLNIINKMDAVIDKDMASGLLAENIHADELYILTDVPYIYKDYGLPSQEKLEFLNYADTIKHLENGTFAEGTMEPKIKACLKFIENGGKKSVITEATKLEDRSFGSKITMEYE